MPDRASRICPHCNVSLDPYADKCPLCAAGRAVIVPPTPAQPWTPIARPYPQLFVPIEVTQSEED